MYSHIEDLLSGGFESIDQGLQKVDELKQKMGTSLKGIFNANDENDQVDGNRQTIEEIGGEIVASGSWLESIREKLRSLQKVLGKQLRKLKKACEDELKTLEKLKEALARDWGDDALIVAGLTWALSKAGSKSWAVRKFIGKAKVTLGAVARFFVCNNFSEEAEEEAGVED